MNKERVCDFMKRLEDKADDGLARLVYSGKALSKSDQHLHMCVSSGVVLIPLSEIEEVDQIYPDIDADLVNVTVKNANLVRHIMKLEQLRDTPTARSPQDSPGDHFLHGTATTTENPPFYDDACDATDVAVPGASFRSR